MIWIKGHRGSNTDVRLVSNYRRDVVIRMK